MKKLTAVIIFILLFVGITACTTTNKTKSDSSKEHIHTSTEDVPDGLMEAANPKYMDGSSVSIKANHMKGMKGAKGTVLSSYNTTVYMVSYTPTTGGEKVRNHKWVVQEEMKNAGKTELASGTKVTLEADHMAGMKGATAKIESAEKATVYMVDYTPTTGGKKVTNHKWLTENELKAE
ncbi:MAG: YdhK family protein [Bacillus sp. (in: firmicutes)]